MKNNFCILYTDNKLNKYTLTTNKRENIMIFYNVIIKNNLSNPKDILSCYSFKEVKALLVKNYVYVFDLSNKEDYSNFLNHCKLYGFDTFKQQNIKTFIDNYIKNKKL